MNKEVEKNLEKNQSINKKLLLIYELIEKKEYKEAYSKIIEILKDINKKYIKSKYNFDIRDLSIINITKFYISKDKKLYENMKAINGELNDVDLNDIKIEDIEYLTSFVDLIYVYMTNNIGEFV